jgi:hypothetical protein
MRLFAHLVDTENCKEQKYRLHMTFHTNFIHNQVTVPALASVYNEKALKSQFDTSIYLQVCVHFYVYLALAFYS